MFYGQQSQFVWHDTQGHAHVITQAEGGEQGDPLMPALFALGQRPALREVQRQLAPNEYLIAFLGDIYVAVTPQRVRPVYDLLATHLHHHARIHLNQGKTRVWNAAGTNFQKRGEPLACKEISVRGCDGSFAPDKQYLVFLVIEAKTTIRSH